MKGPSRERGWCRRCLVCAGATATLLATGPAAPAGSAPASGTLSTAVNSFGSNAADKARTLVIQRDGKIVTAGISESACDDSCFEWDGFALARYLPNGRLDPSFGRAGKVLTESRHGDLAAAIAVQADGKLVVAGGSIVGWSGFTLLRYTRAGRLDRTFGRGGVVNSALSSECDAEPRALAMQRDGKIVVAGHCLEKYPGEGALAAALARYTPDGRLDPTFGNGGSVLNDLDFERQSAGYAVAIQADGRMVVAGSGNSDHVALARYMSDGRADPSFGSAGKVIDVPGAAYALALQPDGKIVAAGTGALGVARFAPDGSLDNSFGRGGRVPVEFDVSGLSLQDDGKVVAAGGTTRGAFAVRRYLSEGAPDAGFGSGGRVITGFGAKSGAFASEVALQRDGRIVLAGTKEPAKGADADFALARYTTNGRLDRRFGKGGRVVTNFDASVVGFASLRATRQKRAVLVRWRTISEDGIRGFRIYRQPPLSNPVRVSRMLITRRGSATRGASYAFRDRGAPAVTRGYLYRLQEVRRDGRTVWRGQAVVNPKR